MNIIENYYYQNIYLGRFGLSLFNTNDKSIHFLFEGKCIYKSKLTISYIYHKFLGW